MIDAYLERIGYTGSRDATLETLRALHERHMYSVPFENLDIHWHRPIVVDRERFLDKVVRRRRGGFCYELNGAFATLLAELGFEVIMLNARVGRADGTFGRPFDHMALLVMLGDDTRWLADVGFGESFVRPLNIDERAEQREPAGVFRIAEDLVMQMQRGDEWSNEYRFDLDPHPLADFEPMCNYHQTSPESSFTQKRVCSLATETGRITLTENKLITTQSGVKTETPISRENWDRVLFETFGIARPTGS